MIDVPVSQIQGVDKLRLLKTDQAVPVNVYPVGYQGVKKGLVINADEILRLEIRVLVTLDHKRAPGQD